MDNPSPIKIIIIMKKVLGNNPVECVKCKFCKVGKMYCKKVKASIQYHSIGGCSFKQDFVGETTRAVCAAELRIQVMEADTLEALLDAGIALAGYRHLINTFYEMIMLMAENHTMRPDQAAKIHDMEVAIKLLDSTQRLYNNKLDNFTL